MATTQANPAPTVETRKTQVTVFDLQLFDDVKLVRDVQLPTKPSTIEEALNLVGNDKDALLKVIFDGLCEHAVNEARKDLSTFSVVGEDGKPGELYTGTPCSEEKGDAINKAILGIAKAMGYDKSLPKEKKAALKEQAAEFIRSNPAMLASIQGA